jgi:hypothetical protein
MKPGRAQAIVVGSSMAGMLAARVLSDIFERVIVLERDTLPEGPQLRSGVSQARHLHALLPRGRGSSRRISRELLLSWNLPGPKYSTLATMLPGSLRSSIPMSLSLAKTLRGSCSMGTWSMMHAITAAQCPCTFGTPMERDRTPWPCRLFGNKQSNNGVSSANKREHTGHTAPVQSRRKAHKRVDTAW